MIDITTRGTPITITILVTIVRNMCTKNRRNNLNKRETTGTLTMMVTTMEEMFFGAIDFNQDINTKDVAVNEKTYTTL